MAEIKYVDWDGLVYYHSKITDKLTEGIKVGGNVTFEELPDPSFQNLNYIYKVTNKFIVPNNGKFDKTLGLECPENTVLRVTNVEDTYLYTLFYIPTENQQLIFCATRADLPSTYREGIVYVIEDENILQRYDSVQDKLVNLFSGSDILFIDGGSSSNNWQTK